MRVFDYNGRRIVIYERCPMEEKKIRIKWINIKTRQHENIHEVSEDKKWTTSFGMFIENHWNEKIPIKARIEISYEDAGFKTMEENMVLDQQEINHFNIHEIVSAPIEWSTETPVRYDVKVTIYNALGEVLDSHMTYMGFAGQEPFVERQEAIVYYHESGSSAFDDIMCMKQLNIQKIYYCAWEKQEAFYNLCDTYGIKVIDVLPYVEIKPQSIYQIEEYYGLYSNHPCIERYIVSPLMTKSDYYLVKEITSKNRIDIGEYPDISIMPWNRGFRQSRDYEESGLPQIEDSGWLFNSLNQSRPITRVIKKEQQRLQFELNLDQMEILIKSHYAYIDTQGFLLGYEVLEDGISVYKNIEEPLDIQPKSQYRLRLDLSAIDFNMNCQYDLNVFATLAQDTDYEKAGYIFAMEQFRLRTSQKMMEIAPSGLPMRVQAKHRKLFLEGERFSCNISRQTGEILNFALGSKELFLKPLRMECRIGEEEKSHALQFKGYTLHAVDNGTEVICSYKIKGYKGGLEVIFLMNGKNEVIMQIKPSETVPLKATHLFLRLNDSGDAISYFGKGPDDNTLQYNEGAYLGIFDIDALRVDIKRCDVQWMTIGDYEFEVSPSTTCHCKIKKDVNQFTDIEFEFVGTMPTIKMEV